MVQAAGDGGIYLEVHDGDTELAYQLTPDQVAQLKEFLP